MKLIDTAVRWRHGTFVLFCLLSLLGLLALQNLPLELQPGGDRPEITITTAYSGASPAEVEDLITRPLEEVLEQVEGVQEIESSSRAGTSTISLEFNWGTDVNARLVDVLNKLQQAEDLPPEAGESDVEVVGGSSAPMMWVVLAPQPGFSSDPDRYRDLIDDVIVPRLRRVEGVGQFLIVGGQEREVEVVVNPQALADRELSLTDVVASLQANNRNVRGGPLNLGRREYRVRTVNRSDDLGQFDGFILRRNAQGTVYLKDVAVVRMGRQVRSSALILNDQPAAGLGIIRRVGANVPAVSQGIRQTLADLEAQFEADGTGVRFVINYDENDYVRQAVSLLQGNLLGGAILAILVLLLFLGSLRTVLVVAITIPTSLITVFIVMDWLGRSLNIISLAALGFAAGMVVDNAIVVIENVYSHMERGKSPLRAAIDGTREVWGAMLAATLTNVAVFIPLGLVQGEAARLFTDMAIAISAAALISLFAAITLVPMLASLLLRPSEAEQVLHGHLTMGRGGHPLTRALGLTLAGFQRGQNGFEHLILKTVRWSLGPRRVGRRLVVLAIPAGLLVASVALLPPPDYLPEGNRNLVLWLAEPFPGTSIPEAIRLSQGPRDFLKAQPEVDRVMFIERPGRRAIATILKPQFATAQGLQGMVERLRGASNQFSGYRFLIPTRVSIFQDPGKEFQIQIVGADLTQLDALAQQIMGQLRELPGVRAVRPNFVYGAPELQVVPRRARLRELGLAEQEVGAAVEAALGGRQASDYIDGKRRLDVVVELDNQLAQTPADLRQLPLYTAAGRPVPLGDVADVVETTGPDAINHVDLERSITLTVSLEPTAPLGALVDQTERQILAPLRADLPPGYRLVLAGTADRLAETVLQLAQAFLLSVLITYLLLVALYRSFVYPLVIMATVPMGLSGALLSLVLVNGVLGWTLPLDMITALGFIILTGVVVNNAILLVDRSLQLWRDEGQTYDAALYQATQDRLRAIFMSAATSVLGMLPLAVVPGQGAELYQGLGIALVGGLTFSTLLTPTVVPALMGLLRDVRPQPHAPLPVPPQPQAAGRR